MKVLAKIRRGCWRHMRRNPTTTSHSYLLSQTLTRAVPLPGIAGEVRSIVPTQPVGEGDHTNREAVRCGGGVSLHPFIVAMRQRMFGCLAAGSAGLLLLTACAGPRPETPPSAAVTTPEGWRSATANAAPIDWSSFGDPVLTALVEQALANNTDIAAAAVRVTEARAGFQAAQGALLPSISLPAGISDGRSLSALGTPVTQTSYQANLQLSYELDLFGRLRDASAAARAQLQASEAARDTVRLSVAATTATGYITLRALDARLAILEDTLKTRDAALELARRRASTGYSPDLELRQAEADRQGVAAQIPAVQSAIRRQEDALSLLLGDTPRAIERGLALDRLIVPAVPVAVPSQVLRQRPDVAQAEATIVAADRSLDAARAAFLPVFSLTASGGVVGSSRLPKDYDVFSIGASVLQPIFQGGRLQANQTAAAARRDQAAFAYRRTALNAFREVEDALANVSSSAGQEQVLTSQTLTLTDVLRMATERYREGYSPFLEQLDAQRSLLTTQLARTQARADRLTAAVTLWQATGGGIPR